MSEESTGWYLPSTRRTRTSTTGYPVVDVRVRLVDGKYHPVDSSDIAFQIAGSMGFKEAAAEAQLVLLEPVMNVSVRVPEEFMGDIIGDLNAKRARISGMEP